MKLLPLLFFVIPLLVLSRPIDPEDGATPPKKPKPNNPPPKSNAAETLPSSSSSCYFSTVKKPSVETVERDSFTKVTTNCGGTLMKWSETVGKFGGDLYGASDEMDLLAIRGAAEYHDFEDGAVISELGNRWVCPNHLKELVTNWNTGQHVRKDSSSLVPSSRSRYKCGMPPSISEHSGNIPKTPGGSFLTREEGKRLLLKEGVHAHIGTPLCNRHKSSVSISQCASQLESAVTIDEPITTRLRSVVKKHEDIGTCDVGALDVSVNNQVTTVAPTAEGTSRTTTDVCKSRFLEWAEASGIKFISSRKPYNTLNRRSKQRKADATRELIEIAFHLLAPGYAEDLRELTLNDEADQWTNLRAKLFDDLMQNIVAEYNKMTTRKERRSLLSLVAATLPYSTLLKYFPTITRYEYTKSRMHAALLNHKPYVSTRREKFTKEFVVEFVDFITSPMIRVDLPYGRRILTKSDGSKLIVSDTLRNVRAIEIVEMFIKYKTDRNEQHQLMSRSTYFKILEKCKATTREALDCVDYFLSDALDSFEKLFVSLSLMKTSNFIDDFTAKNFDKRLHDAKLYLQTDYKLHVKFESKIADHCIKHALSDSSVKIYQETCANSPLSHDHNNHQCERCQGVRDVFADLLETVGELIDSAQQKTLRETDSENVKAEADLTIVRNEIQLAEKNIQELKKHLVRNKHSNEVRQRIVEQLQPNEAFLTLDWAQKILPRKATESQRCYHSAKTITSLSEIAKRAGVNIKSYTFSEAQGGKGAADRTANEMKRKLRTWLGSGHNAETPSEIFTALTEGRVPLAMSTYLVSVDYTSAQLGTTVIDGVQNVYDFRFDQTTEEMTMRKFGLIGTGKKLSTKNFVASKGSMTVEKSGGFLPTDNTSFWKTSTCKKKCLEDNNEAPENMLAFQQNDVDVETSNPKPMETVVFQCPEEGCDATFLNSGNLENHVVLGKHKIQPERETLMDVAFDRYSENLEGVSRGQISTTLQDVFKELPAGSMEFVANQGWALPEKRANKRYDKAAVEFVYRKFKEVSKNNQKIFPKLIEKDLREARKSDGTLQFLPECWLNYKQILNLYRTFGKKTCELAASKNKESDENKENETVAPATAAPAASSPSLRSSGETNTKGTKSRPKRDADDELIDEVLKELQEREFDDSEDIYDSNNDENGDFTSLLQNVEDNKKEIFLV